MANRLQKLAITSYSPGTPYQPAEPARCTTSTELLPDAYVLSGYTVVTSYDTYGHTVLNYVPRFALVPAHYQTTTKCTPAIPAQPGVPSTTTYTAVTGWNAGAHSIDYLVGDGYIKLFVSPSPFGVVFGLASNDSTTLPSEQSHAFYIHGSQVDIMEYGTVVATAVHSHALDDEYRITRRGETVTYTVGAYTRTSLAASAGAVFMDVSMYASGDYVYDPEVVDESNTGAASGALPALTGRAGKIPYGYVTGRMARLSGTAVQNPTSIAAGSLRALTGLSADHPYGEVKGSFPRLTGEIVGGYPQVSIISLVGSFAPLSGYAVGLTGGIGGASGSLQPLQGLAADRVYGEVRGSFRGLTGLASSGWPVPNEAYKIDPVYLVDYFQADDTQFASISSTLELDGYFDAVVEVDAAIYDALMLGDYVSVSQAIEAMIGGGLLLGNGTTSVRGPDVNGGTVAGYQPLQYAVNVQTSAITTYVNFDFLAYANVGQDLYGAKPDGVYLVRPGSDDGAGINAFIDFGTSTFGSTKVKSVSAAYLGVATDGELYLRMETEDTDKLYRVVQRGHIMRALPSKGIAARQWNVSLEVVDATEFEIDTLEIQVGVSSGRWTSR